MTLRNLVFFTIGGVLDDPSKPRINKITVTRRKYKIFPSLCCCPGSYMYYKDYLVGILLVWIESTDGAVGPELSI